MLSVLLQWALRRPQKAGRATGMALTLFYFNPLSADTEGRKALIYIMNIDVYYSTVEGKENKSCVIETTAGIYEGVYIGTKCPADNILMIFRPTGKTRETLAYVAAEGCELKENNNLFGTPVALIKEITFLS